MREQCQGKEQDKGRRPAYALRASARQPSLAVVRQSCMPRRSSRMSVRMEFFRKTSERMLVGLGRLELPTSPLSGARSSHLSYRPNRCSTSRCPTIEPCDFSIREQMCIGRARGSCIAISCSARPEATTAPRALSPASTRDRLSPRKIIGGEPCREWCVVA